MYIIMQLNGCGNNENLYLLSSSLAVTQLILGKTWTHFDIAD